MLEKYQNLIEITGIQFEDQPLLDTAFTHKSFINEHPDDALDHNERLEFLGDAVLELVVTNHLFLNFPQKPEGEMTAYRSALVKGKNLAQVAKKLSLGDYLRLSKGEEKSGGRSKNYLLANTVEALIGAIYLEKGLLAAQKFIEDFILTRLDEIIENDLHIDNKSKFQVLSQEKESSTPYYQVLEEEGPDHDKNFLTGAYINGRQVGQGRGSSKQKAEEAAAKDALKNLKWN